MYLIIWLFTDGHWVTFLPHLSDSPRPWTYFQRLKKLFFFLNSAANTLSGLLFFGDLLTRHSPQTLLGCVAVDCVLSSKEVWKHFSLVRNIFHPWQLCPLHQTEHLSWISSFRLPADVFLYASQSLVCSAESLDVSGQTASGNIFSAAVRTRHRGSWNIWQTSRYSSSRLLFTVGWSGHFLLNASNWMTSGRWRGSMGSAVPGSAGAFESRADVDGWHGAGGGEGTCAAHSWHFWISIDTFLNNYICPPSRPQRRTLEGRHVRGKYI